MPDTTAPLKVTALNITSYKVDISWVEPTGVPPLGGDIDRYDIYTSANPITIIPSGDPVVTVDYPITTAEVPITDTPTRRQYIAVVAVDTSENKSPVKVLSARLTKPVDIKSAGGGKVSKTSGGFYIFF